MTFEHFDPYHQLEVVQINREMDAERTNDLIYAAIHHFSELQSRGQMLVFVQVRSSCFPKVSTLSWIGKVM